MTFKAAQLRVDILEEFTLLHHFVPRTPWKYTASGGLEALRRAYRARNLAKGLCISCPTPAVVGIILCLKHRQAQRLAARTSREKRCEDKTRAKREARRVRRMLTRIFKRSMVKATRCSSCREEGHNRMTCPCPAIAKARYYDVKGVTHCSHCGYSGHNRATCLGRDRDATRSIGEKERRLG